MTPMLRLFVLCATGTCVSPISIVRYSSVYTTRIDVRIIRYETAVHHKYDFFAPCTLILWKNTTAVVLVYVHIYIHIQSFYTKPFSKALFRAQESKTEVRRASRQGKRPKQYSTGIMDAQRGVWQQAKKNYGWVGCSVFTTP